MRGERVNLETEVVADDVVDAGDRNVHRSSASSGEKKNRCGGSSAVRNRTDDLLSPTYALVATRTPTPPGADFTAVRTCSDSSGECEPDAELDITTP